MKFQKLIKYSKKEALELTEIILEANNNTIIAQIGENFLIDTFIKKCVDSKYIDIFVVREKLKIIGYSIISKNQNYFSLEFSNYKFLIFFNLILKFNLAQLYNLILIFLKKDLILFEKKNLNKINNAVNLTYLAIHKNYRNKNIGRKFLKIIFKKYDKNKFITVETDNHNTLNFYKKYMNFKIIGTRKRLPKKLFLLMKKNI